MSIEYYEDDAMNKISLLKTNIAQMINMNKSDLFDAINNSYGTLNDVKNTVSEMKSQFILVPTNSQMQVKKKIQEFEADIQQIESQLIDNTKRQKLMRESEQMRKQIADGELLQEASTHITETVEIGHGILSSLSDQRSTLGNAMNNLGLIDESVSDTTSLVGNMTKRQNQNRLLMWGIVVMLVVAIFLVIYISF